MILPKLLRLIEKMPEMSQEELYKELLQRPVKRKHIRRESNKEIGYCVDGNEYISLMKDMSFGGAFLETDEKFTVGQIIQLELPMVNSAKVIKTTATIVRVAKNGIGIEFNKRNK